MLRLLKNNKVKPAAVYARITGDSYRTEISLKNRVSINNWNEVKRSAKGKQQEIAKLNRYLEQVRSSIFDCYQELMQ